MYVYLYIQVIVLNTLMLGTQHELDSPIGALWARNDAMLAYLRFRVGIEAANMAFLGIYTAELVLKVVGLGLKEYLSRASNLVDATIVVLGFYEFYGVLELFLCFQRAANNYQAAEVFVNPCADSNAALSVFRAFRLVRLVTYIYIYTHTHVYIGMGLERLRPVGQPHQSAHLPAPRSSLRRHAGAVARLECPSHA